MIKLRYQFSLLRNNNCKTETLRLAQIFIVALSTSLTLPNPAFAQMPLPDPLDLPKGLACPSFDLQIRGLETRTPKRKILDEAGNVVLSITAGKGNDLTFKNLNSGSTYHLKANGSVAKAVLNPDGSTTYTNTGHNGLIMFPSDVPPGPSTIIYTGRMIYTVDANGTFFFQGSSGKQLDICTILAG
jgi:hypothetical protein